MMKKETTPVMTIATILMAFSIAFAGIVDLLPPKWATIAAAIIFSAGAMGRGLFYMHKQQLPPTSTTTVVQGDLLNATDTDLSPAPRDDEAEPADPIRDL